MTLKLFLPFLNLSFPKNKHQKYVCSLAAIWGKQPKVTISHLTKWSQRGLSYYISGMDCIILACRLIFSPLGEKFFIKLWIELYAILNGQSWSFNGFYWGKINQIIVSLVPNYYINFCTNIIMFKTKIFFSYKKF